MLDVLAGTGVGVGKFLINKALHKRDLTHSSR